jgi:hypothetical protein
LTPKLQKAFQAVEQRPRDPHAWAGLGDAFRLHGQLGPAEEAYQRSLGCAPTPRAFQGWAACAEARGQLGQAVGILSAARSRGMLSLSLLRSLGKLALDVGDLAAAENALAEYTARAPEDGQGFLLRAIGATRQGLGEAAIGYLDRAVLLMPTDPDAHANRAAVLESLSRLPEAEQAARRALALSPGQPLATLTLARVLRRSRQEKAALDVLATLDPTRLAPRQAARCEADRGMCLDGLGNTEQAWAAFEAMNRHAVRRPDFRLEAGTRFSQMVDDLQHLGPQLAALAAEPWAPPADGPVPVFVVGFPRSGTTLLETILGAHPELVATDEMRLTDRWLGEWSELLPDLPAYPAGVLQLTPTHRLALRSRWRQLLQEERPHLDPTLRVIDKVPLNLVHLPLLHAIFPEAPKVVLLRDPRDTAVSCFQQDFGPGASNNLMVDMASIAHLQARVFRFYASVGPTLGESVHVVRYEQLVEDHLSVSQRLLTAMGLSWDDRVAQYREGLQGAHITTPSYEQVIQPVHTRARAKWRRYAAQLGPWRATLDETARLLGYLD